MVKLPHMLTCRELEEFISDYIDGKLPTITKAKFIIHLFICRDCRSYIDAYKRSIEMGKSLCDKLDSESQEDVPEELITFVLENIKNKDSKED
jgi:predicted anti-sigma-YlaC factor YlaD